MHVILKFRVLCLNTKHLCDYLMRAFEVNVAALAVAALNDSCSDPWILEQKASGHLHFESQVVSFVLTEFFDVDDVVLAWLECVVELICKVKLCFILWINAFKIGFFWIRRWESEHPLPMVADTDRKHQFFNLALKGSMSSQYRSDLFGFESEIQMAVCRQIIDL